MQCCVAASVGAPSPQLLLMVVEGAVAIPLVGVLPWAWVSKRPMSGIKR